MSLVFTVYILKNALEKDLSLSNWALFVLYETYCVTIEPWWFKVYEKS